ncbi:MAG: glycosyltransferase [Candidatus Promineifilaceae bacterium]
MLERPLVSIVIAAWNEEARIEGVLNRVLGIAYRPIEFIVCAGGDDATYTLAATFQPRIILLRQRAGEGKQKAVKHCLTVSAGHIVVFYDGDVFANSDSFECLIAPILEDGEKAATGVSRPLPAQQRDLFVRYQWAFQEHRQTIRNTIYTHSVLGRNFALHRDILNVLQMQTTAAISEDLLLGLTLLDSGYKIRYVPESYVETLYPPDFWTYVRQTNRGLRGHIMIGLMLQKRSLLVNGTKTIAVGLCGLFAPLLALVSWWGVLIWGLIWGGIVVRRTHYMRLRNEIENEFVSPFGWGLLKFTIASFVAWSWVAVQLFGRKWRTKWL